MPVSILSLCSWHLSANWLTSDCHFLHFLPFSWLCLLCALMEGRKCRGISTPRSSPQTMTDRRWSINTPVHSALGGIIQEYVHRVLITPLGKIPFSQRGSQLDTVPFIGFLGWLLIPVSFIYSLLWWLRFFAALYMSTSDCESPVSIDFGGTNKFY